MMMQHLFVPGRGNSKENRQPASAPPSSLLTPGGGACVYFHLMGSWGPVLEGEGLG